MASAIARTLLMDVLENTKFVKRLSDIVADSQTDAANKMIQCVNDITPQNFSLEAIKERAQADANKTMETSGRKVSDAVGELFKHLEKKLTELELGGLQEREPIDITQLPEGVQGEVLALEAELKAGKAYRKELMERFASEASRRAMYGVSNQSLKQLLHVLTHKASQMVAAELVIVKGDKPDDYSIDKHIEALEDFGAFVEGIHEALHTQKDSDELMFLQVVSPKSDEAEPKDKEQP